jgi:two-component sensor histidine kinase/PAS domain-containing protein
VRSRISRYRTRVILTFVVPWVAATLFSFWYLSYIQRVAGERNALRHLDIVSDMLATSVGAGLNDADFSLVQKALDWTKLDRNVTYICILDENDEVLYQTGVMLDIPLDVLKKSAPGISRTATDLVSVTEVVPGEKRLGTVILIYSLEGIEQEIKSAQMTSIVVSLVVLLVGILGTRLLVRQTMELDNARNDAERQAATVRMQAVDLASMNASLGKSNLTLLETQRELQQAHDELEQRVEARTNALAEANAELHVRQGYLELAMTAARMFPWRMDLSTGEITVSEDHLRALGLQSAGRDLLVAHIHPADRVRVVQAFREASQGLVPLDVEFRAMMDPEHPIWFAAYGRPMIGTDGRPTLIVGINLDITERKRTEEAVRTSLREKEILLKEVHHRVKNNMQIISSLLFLQSSYVRDPYDVELFRESQMRVKSMATVHERLYRSEDLSSIEFSEYVRTITDELLASYTRPGIELMTAVDDVRFGVDIAIPCGLLITELVTNAIKHAFPEGRDGRINIAGNLTDGMMHLSVADNGIGYPADVDFTGGETLGVMLIRGLTDQLDGTIVLDRTGGSRVMITFPLHRMGEEGEAAL